MVHSNEDMPVILRDFMVYIETIKGKSPKTADEYYLDLRVFFRFLLYYKDMVPEDTPFEKISIANVDIELLRTVILSDIYAYMNYLSRERLIIRNQSISGCGLGPAARARKTSSLRVFFRYLTSKVKLLDENPCAELETPKQKKNLPRHLNVEESKRLLDSVDGPNRVRDYLILTLFLNCGLRVSELVNINLGDFSDGQLRVLGKGNKERIVYLNEACLEALNDYLPLRAELPIAKTENALFISRNSNRISTSTVKWLVKKHIGEAGLDETRFSCHKLRHTAATIMYQNGVDVRTLQNVLGHESLNTTRIYTHVSDGQVRDAIASNPLAHYRKKSKEESENPE